MPDEALQIITSTLSGYPHLDRNIIKRHIIDQFQGEVDRFKRHATEAQRRLKSVTSPELKTLLEDRLSTFARQVTRFSTLITQVREYSED